MSKIVSSDGPNDEDQVSIDTRSAVLMDVVNVAVLGNVREGKMNEVILALELAGRVNKSTDYSDIVYLIDADGAAAIIVELFSLAQRIGPEFSKYFDGRLNALS